MQRKGREKPNKINRLNISIQPCQGVVLGEVTGAKCRAAAAFAGYEKLFPTTYDAGFRKKVARCTAPEGM